MFVTGRLFEHIFKTVAGEVGLLAEVEIVADTLWLKDIAVYPTHVNELHIGQTEVKKCLLQIEEWARIEGFRRLRITGTRMSGASKGRRVNFTRVL